MTRLAKILSVLVPLLAPSDAIAADDQPNPGLRYAVTGVASGDRLNVRDFPQASASIVGSFAPGAEVTVTGSRWQMGDSMWWQVVPEAPGGSPGWVNARFLSRVQPPGSAFEDRDYPVGCLGTEPFWSLSTAEGRATFNLLTMPTSLEASGWIAAAGTPKHNVIRLRETSAEARAGYLSLLAPVNALCSDGMSEREFWFYGTLILPDGRVFGGCCWRAG